GGASPLPLLAPPRRFTGGAGGVLVAKAGGTCGGEISEDTGTGEARGWGGEGGAPPPPYSYGAPPNYCWATLTGGGGEAPSPPPPRLRRGGDHNPGGG
ncbi:hypothetical protein G9A89_000318, partial [Geosiphon pyriformis]